eukprot:TRINITY_DN2544_c0_g1_i3.p1 TRINITY_DN2544_c0_g1~~TRINITY_DN2544_c0_g1_i3.p1  ORF type:complete len:211 (+),score=65.65 TRINITY_DN2544_c0_g1_i3:93-635(+)
MLRSLVGSEMCIRDMSDGEGESEGEGEGEEVLQEAEIKLERKEPWSLWERHLEYEAVDRVLEDLLKANPQCSELRLRRGLAFRDGKLETWNLSQCDLSRLPESFGSVQIGVDMSDEKSTFTLSAGVSSSGCLFLNNNHLSCLPRSFGSLQVEGDLFLDKNFLNKNQVPELPHVKGEVRVD